MDNILKKGDKLIVLDYKTRGYPLKEDTHEHYKDQMDLYNFLLRKNGYKTEDYTILLFYHPIKIHKDGNVEFHSDLIKIPVNIKNAENIIKKAIKTLKEPMPQPAEGCEYCKWVEYCNCEV